MAGSMMVFSYICIMSFDLVPCPYYHLLCPSCFHEFLPSPPLVPLLLPRVFVHIYKP